MTKPGAIATLSVPEHATGRLTVEEFLSTVG